MTFVSTAMVIPASLKDRKKKISGNGIVFWEANEDTCRKKNLYEEEHDLAQEEFTTKYGMFGEKLKTEEEIAREKREHTHRLYMMSDVPEYVEISGKWLAAEGELREYRDQCLKQGMELMTKYFRNLWD